jgi:acyl carrier protein
MSQEDALKWFAELFGLPVHSVSPATTRAEVLTWDSLGVLTLRAALDETFNILVNDADMRSMQKIGDVIDLLRKHGKVV